MKILKVMLFLLFVITAQQAKAQLLIARIDAGGQPVLVADQTYLKTTWKAILQRESSINETFTSASTVKVDNLYYLVMKGKTYTSNILLQVGVERTQLIDFGVSCTTKSCITTDGCTPDGTKKCTSCLGGLGDCTKTVTSNPKGFFFEAN